MGIVGGYIGYNFPTWDKNLLIAVNEKRKERGFQEISRDTVNSFTGYNDEKASKN
jgi:hypothetical protein